MNICFLEKTNFKYNSKDIYSNNLRGAETVLINLSKALSEQGHNVTIFNNCPKNETINNIKWININNDNSKIENFDIAFSNNDTRLFGKIKSNKKILISHSLQNLEKFIRKSQLFSYLKYKPKVLLLGDYHEKTNKTIVVIW